MIFFTDNYQDRSTNDGYQFEFYCRRCGNGYTSSFQHSATGFGGRTLADIAALPDRRDALADLARQTELALGFKQLVSVRRPAAGVTSWQDHAAAPHIGAHDSPGGSFQPGMMGMMAAGVMSAGPPLGPGAVGGPGGWGGPGGPFGFGEGYGTYGDYWAFRALVLA
jgi:hypothetical protein